MSDFTSPMCGGICCEICTSSDSGLTLLRCWCADCKGWRDERHLMEKIQARKALRGSDSWLDKRLQDGADSWLNKQD